MSWERVPDQQAPFIQFRAASPLHPASLPSPAAAPAGPWGSWVCRNFLPPSRPGTLRWPPLRFDPTVGLVGRSEEAVSRAPALPGASE